MAVIQSAVQWHLWAEDIYPSAKHTLTYADNFDELVDQFKKTLSKALDDVAPIQTKQPTVRKSIPWFTDEVKEHKQFMRRREKIWRRYKTEDTKTAFIKAQSEYKQQIRREKVRTISTKVIESWNRHQEAV